MVPSQNKWSKKFNERTKGEKSEKSDTIHALYMLSELSTLYSYITAYRYFISLAAHSNAYSVYTPLTTNSNNKPTK